MRQAVIAKVLGGLKRYGPDLAIISCLVVASLWVRRLTLWDIEAGGDAIRKWFFVKQWSYGNSFSELDWNHHLTRFGINLWAYVVQKLWGTAPAAYFIAPVLAATAAVVFCYKLAQEISGRYAGVLAALWLMTLEPMERAGSQLLPGAFEAAYVTGALYFLVWYLRFTGDVRWRRVLLGLSALFLFFGYLSKMSALLFVPGIVLALWFLGGSRRDLLFFVGLFLGCYLIETAWYALFTESTTRFEIVNNSHRGGTVKEVTRTVTSVVTSGGGGGGGKKKEVVVDLVAVFWKLTERYRVLWESIKFPLFFFLGAAPALAVFGAKKPAKAVMFAVFGYLFLATFSIRQLKPLKIWMSNEPRYFIVLCPLLLAVNAALLVELVKRAKHALRPRLARRTFKWLWFPVHPGLAPVWALLLCLLVADRYYQEHGRRWWRQEFPLKQVERHRQRFNDAFARGLPIAERRSRHKKALRLIWSVYLEEDRIARDGRLPSFEDAVARLDSGYDWLGKDTLAYRDDALQKVRKDRRCAYVARIRGRFLHVEPKRKLSEDCRAIPSRARSR